MNIFQRVSYAGKILLNNKPNEIREVGVDKSENRNKHSVDLVDTTPSKIRRTVRNCRFASRDPQVHGILVDIMTKTNGIFELKGDSKAVNHILEVSKDWDLDNKFDESIWKGLVDGEGFLYTRIVDNHLKMSWLAYDNHNYRIKIIYDEDGELLGYKQIIKKNVRTNTGWLKKKFDELTEEESEEIEFNFTPEEVTHFKFLERDGKGHSPVMNVLDDVHYKRVLKDLMPLTVYKNSSIFHVQMGNEKKMNTYLDEKARDRVSDTVNDYHKKGCLILPYGIEVEMIKGNSSLPNIQEYLKYYEKNIYIGLNTPEAVFSSESSNRSTVDIQLDSPTSGRVLYFQYIQEWLKKYWEEIFKKELELHHIKGEVTIEFLSRFNHFSEDEESEEEDEYVPYVTPDTKGKPIRYKGTENDDRSNSTTIKKNNNHHPSNHDVPNITEKVKKYSKAPKKRNN